MLAVLVSSGLASCGQSTPTATTLARRTAATMASSSYRISGAAVAGGTTTTFSVATMPDGDFSGQVVTRVPGSPSLSLQVVAVAGKVYVLSPLGLQQLGVTSLPGNLNPATTWVEQPPAPAQRYLRSIAPFCGRGIGRTLTRYLDAPHTISSAELDGVGAWLVEEGAAGSSLRLYIAKGSYRLLELTVAGKGPISLSYTGFGRIGTIAPPPPAHVYVPPSTSASS
ncbi:MAG: hypothetical protein ACYCX9_06575 [Candidatus Dormibacteria bacterium]